MKYPDETLLTKMWESLVDKAIGGLLRPWQMRREGSAAIDVRVEEKLRLAQAEQDAQTIRRGEATLDENRIIMLSPHNAVEVIPLSDSPMALLASITEKITSAATADTIRKEVNVAKAILEAEAELENDPSPPPEQPVNDDWLYRWRDYASEVSSEEIQSMWGRVLAGETKAPGSFSLRTMDFLRNISQKEAQSIAKIAPYKIQNFIYRDQNFLDKSEISFEFLIFMQEIGILSGVESIGMTNSINSSFPDKTLIHIGTKHKFLILEHEDSSKSASFPIYLVTDIGQQILELCKITINENYLRALANHFIKNGFSVKLATAINIVGDTINYREEKLEVVNS